MFDASSIANILHPFDGFLHHRLRLWHHRQFRRRVSNRSVTLAASCSSDVQHTVHSNELFVIRKHKRNGQPDQGVCDIRHAVHSDELFAFRQDNRNGAT